MTLRARAACVAAAGALGLAGTASAFVNWAVPNGAGSFFTYTGGGSDFGLMGNGTLAFGNTFVFTPPAFKADSVNGVADSMTDRIQVVLHANPGQKFTQLKVTELGDWSIVGIGTAKDSGTLQVSDNINPRFPPALQSPLSYFDNNTNAPLPMPIITPGNGIWRGTSLIDLTLPPNNIPDWTDLTLVLTNTIQATTTGASTSHIQKTFAQATVTIEVLPTPGGAALLGLGGLVIARRRRRA